MVKEKRQGKEKFQKDQEKLSKITRGKKYFSGTGRRKRAVARVRIFTGDKIILINGQDLKKYFEGVGFAQEKILEPLKLSGQQNRFGISILVSGGGKSSQVEACRLGLARALVKAQPNLRTTLSRAGFLTRDPREKERKKPGLKAARRAPQWQKR